MKTCRLCGEPHCAKGYCEKHYKQYIRGTLNESCYLKRCERLAVRLNMCQHHYQLLAEAR